MNTTVLQKILSTDAYTSKWFAGFSTPDLTLPQHKKKPSLFVLNTDKALGPGKHWCIAIFFKNGTCEFFDSAGQPPTVYGFDKILQTLSSTIVYNPQRVQDVTSSTCGHHCLFFALNRSRGISLEDIIQKYSPTNFKMNDRMVYEFVRQNFGNTYAHVH